MQDRSTPARGMPLVVATALAMASLCTLLVLPGDHEEKRPQRTAPTASIAAPSGARLADAALTGFPRGLASGSQPGGRMPSR